MEREPYLGAGTDRVEEIQELAPPRDIHWTIDKLHEEALEVQESDYENNTKEFQDELADLQIAIWTVMLHVGINRVDFYERIVPEKADVVIDRLKDAFILSRGGAMTFDEAYNGIKSLEGIDKNS